MRSGGRVLGEPTGGEGINGKTQVCCFFSSAFFPRETMSGAYKRIADINPISYLVEGLRALVLEGFTFSAVVRSLLVPTVICVAAILFALKELNRKLAAL